MNDKRLLPQITGLTLLLMLLTACATPQPTPTPIPPIATSTLEGTEWVLISLNGEGLIEEGRL